MPPLKSSKCKSVRLTAVFLTIIAHLYSYSFVLTPYASAADIEAVLDTNDGSTGFVVQDSDSVNQTRMDSDGNLVTPGNVAIGTTTPAGRLIIQGDEVRVGSGGTIDIADSDGDLYIQNDLEVDRYLYGSRIFASGNIGIGTTSPQARMQLIGGDFLLGNGTFDNASADPDLYIQGNLEVDGSVWLGDAIADNITVIGTMTQTGTTRQDGPLIVDDDTVEALLIRKNNDLGDILIVDTTNSQVELYNALGIGKTPDSGRELDLLGDLAVSGTSALTGNVGIGTAGPRALLEIGSGGTITSVGANDVYIANDLEVDGVIYGNVTGTINASLTPGAVAFGNSDGTITEDPTQFSFDSTNNRLGIGTSNAEAMLEIVETGSVPFMISNGFGGAGDLLTVTSTGNVGLTTTSPRALLEIGAGGTIDNVGTGDVYIENDLEVDGTIFGSFTGGMSVNADLELNGNMIESNASGIRLDSDDDGVADHIFSPLGFVGLGTTAPSNRLEVIGGDVIVGLGTFNNPSGNGDVYVSGTLEVDGAVHLGDATADNIVVTGTLTQSGAGAQEGTFTIDETDPEALLVRQDGDAKDVFIVDTTNSQVEIYDALGIGKTPDSGRELDVLGDVAVSGTSTLTGNVGIGTAGPRALLEIGTGGTVDSVGANDVYIANDLEVDGTIYGTVSGTISQSADLELNGFMIESATGGINFDSDDDGAADLGVNPAGNVGIGTFEASGQLEIVDNGTVPLMVSSADAADGDFLIVTTTGLVGIGTTSPITQLSVGGATTTTSQMTLWGEYQGAGFTNSNIFNFRHGTLDRWRMTTEQRTSNSDDFDFKLQSLTSDTLGHNDRFIIKGRTGSVGLGTTTPVGGLAVMNGNVGIGTWSPRAGLEIGTGGTINNAGSIDSVYIANDLEVDGTIFGSLSGSMTLSADLETDGFMIESSSGGVIFDSDDDGNADVTFEETGNVGIGTVNPESIFQVAGGDLRVGLGTFNNPSANFDIYTTGNLEVDGILYGDGSGLTNLSAGSTVEDGDQDTRIRTEAAADEDAIRFDTAGTERIVIAPSGNTGVGTASPQARLEIIESGATPFMISNGAGGVGDHIIVTDQGNVGIGTNSPITALHVRRDNAFGPLFVERDTVSTSLARNTLTLLATSSGNMVDGFGPALAFTIQDTADDIQTVAHVAAARDGADNSGALRFFTSQAGTAGEKVRISADGSVGIGTITPVGGLAVMAGNVGIGTWSPRVGLEIGSAGSINSASGNDALYVAGDIEADGTIYGTFSGDGSSLTGLGGAWTDGGTNIFVSDDYTNNVAIGTTTPTKRLTVQVDTTDSSDRVATILRNVNAHNQVRMQLSVADDAGTTGTSGTQVFHTNDAATGAGLANYEARPLSFWTGPAAGSALNRLHISENGRIGIGTTLMSSNTGFAVMNGNVGIGTWNPISALQVVGTVRATAFVGDGSALTGLAAAGGWTDDGTTVRLGTATDNVGIGTTMPVGGLAVMANVGIGTWSPAATLEVDGTVATKPSDTADVTAIGGIAALKMIMRVQGSGGAVEVSANPQIASGVDGQMLILQGDSDANTVKLSNGNGVALQSAVSFTLGQGDTMTLIYDDGDGVWYEVGRTDN